MTSSVAAVTSLAATRVPISSEEEDLSSLGPQEEAKRSQVRASNAHKDFFNRFPAGARSPVSEKVWNEHLEASLRH